jgi:hypothetical protein
MTKAQAFYNFAVGFRLTDEATLLRHNDLAHNFTPIYSDTASNVPVN